ncbi:helix-turn-helix domain-containing protein [Lacinutrix sp. WUR7]|uniref:helix-turn-helix domain-containing protein n=1 Tax=Lacinutrix sp. WUR7 TaxID=2653681 RepID=UPI00193C86E7|nr:helix-turn-helix domain-containing protein [Lacinutrix sp. WUR7]QRM89526.1 helix-turn-helix domain-containing protein [Lacinutrix sp. WUR7]
MKSVQLIGLTPEQLQSAIIDGVKTQLEDLKSHFQPKEPTEYLTRQEVATILKVDLSTIHNWCKSGKLLPYGIGKRVYFKRADLESCIIPLER